LRVEVSRAPEVRSCVDEEAPRHSVEIERATKGGREGASELPLAISSSKKLSAVAGRQITRHDKEVLPGNTNDASQGAKMSIQMSMA